MKKIEVQHDTKEYPVEINIIKKCEFCEGTGEITVLAQVYPGEPHMADVETRPCDACTP